MMEIYSVLSRGFVKLSKNLLAFTTHWVANTNKTKYQTFIYLFEKKYISTFTSGSTRSQPSMKGPWSALALIDRKKIVEHDFRN